MAVPPAASHHCGAGCSCTESTWLDRVGVVPVLCAKTQQQRASQAMSEAAQLQAEAAAQARTKQPELHLPLFHGAGSATSTGSAAAILAASAGSAAASGGAAAGDARSLVHPDPRAWQILQELSTAVTGGNGDGTHESGTAVAKAGRTSLSATLLARHAGAADRTAA